MYYLLTFETFEFGPCVNKQLTNYVKRDRNANSMFQNSTYLKVNTIHIFYSLFLHLLQKRSHTAVKTLQQHSTYSPFKTGEDR